MNIEDVDKALTEVWESNKAPDEVFEVVEYIGIDEGSKPARSMVVIGCQSIGKTALMFAIVERLREKGLDVIVVGADDFEISEPPKQIGIVFDESRAIERLLAAATAKVHDIDCKIDFEWKRERDYPTLKEGIRRNQIRRLKK